MVHNKAYLAERVVIEQNGCWVWQRSRAANGYGRIATQAGGTQRSFSAHRLSYELFKGPVPEGLELDHLCRTRACVNPAHLEAVTRRENALRGVSVIATNAQKTHCKHGHEFTPENTGIWMRQGKFPTRWCRTCKARIEAARQPRRRPRA